MQVSETVFDVAARTGGMLVTGVGQVEADRVHAQNLGSQIRTRSQHRTVPAAFAVMVDGVIVGDPFNNPGEAAKAAKRLGGVIRMVPAK